MTSEITKTSFLIVATIFTGAGASLLLSNPIIGSVLLLIAVGVLALRGWLKLKGIEVEKKI